MRRPSLQFYPGDWQSNPKLRRCTHAEKGIWLDVLCILHDQDEYGIVRWPLKDLAMAVHAKPAALQALIDKRVLKGADVGGQCEVFTYTPRHAGRDGETVLLIPAQEGPIWYSSRMVRDEFIRLARSANEPKPKRTPKAGIGADIGAGGRSHPSRAGVSSSSSPSPPGEKKERRADKPRDPRQDHPAIQAVREAKGSFPVKDTWDLVIKVVGAEPDLERMKQCWLAWRGKGHSPMNLDWLIDWYINGIPGVKNGTSKAGFESGSERSSRNLQENIEYIRRLSG